MHSHFGGTVYACSIFVVGALMKQYTECRLNWSAVTEGPRGGCKQPVVAMPQEGGAAWCRWLFVLGLFPTLMMDLEHSGRA